MCGQSENLEKTLRDVGVPECPLEKREVQQLETSLFFTQRPIELERYMAVYMSVSVYLWVDAVTA